MKAKKKEKSLKKESKKPEQTNLFGDQDFVYNVLQTELSDIAEEMMRTREAISKKEEKLEKLKGRKEEVYKATKIVADQKDKVKKEAEHVNEPVVKEEKHKGDKKEKA